MGKIILSINAGSSSVKVSVYEAPQKAHTDPKSLAVAQIDGLTAPPPILKYSRSGQKVEAGKKLENISSQGDAFRYILEHLERDEGLPELKDRSDIEYATHRVVHGGDYPKAQVIDADTYHHIEELSDLAPL
jgi:acetate kinase